MYYAPHILQRRTQPTCSYDEYGRLVVDNDTERWEYVGACRCDKTNQTLMASDNGDTFHCDYRIVLSGKQMVTAGDVLRVLNDGIIMCCGEARSVRETNYLNYTEVMI